MTGRTGRMLAFVCGVLPRLRLNCQNRSSGGRDILTFRIKYLILQFPQCNSTASFVRHSMLGKCTHLSNSTPSVCSEDFLLKHLQSPGPSRCYPENVTMTSSGLLFQTLQSLSRATEEIIQVPSTVSYCTCCTICKHVLFCFIVHAGANFISLIPVRFLVVMNKAILISSNCSFISWFEMRELSSA